MSCLKFQSKFMAIAWIVFGVAACSTFDKKVQVSVDQDIQLANADGSQSDVAKNTPFDLTEDALLVEAKGHNSVVLVPIQAQAGEVKIKMRPATNWVGEAFYKASNEAVSEIIAVVVKTQQSIATNNLPMALASLDKLQEKYPHITYLHFLRASTLTMMRREQDAQIALEKALKDFPQDIDGNALYRSLTGRKFDGLSTEVKE